jgi:hypothetical protein
MTARRFAAKRFAFTPTVLLTDHLPVLVKLVGRELGVSGVLLFAVGCIAAIRERNATAAVSRAPALGCSRWR